LEVAELLQVVLMGLVRHVAMWAPRLNSAVALMVYITPLLSLLERESHLVAAQTIAQHLTLLDVLQTLVLVSALDSILCTTALEKEKHVK
jgi:hypothetical protein